MEAPATARTGVLHDYSLAVPDVRRVRINRKRELAITVDKLKIAQFIYLILGGREKLLLNYEARRNVINNPTSKAVLVDNLTRLNRINLTSS